MSRVPATLNEAPATLAQVDPQALAPRTEGYRYHECTSTYGEMAPRWVLISSSPASRKHSTAESTPPGAAQREPGGRPPGAHASGPAQGPQRARPWPYGGPEEATGG